MNTRACAERCTLEGWPIKINAFICIDSARSAPQTAPRCYVNARGDEDKYLYRRVKTRGNPQSDVYQFAITSKPLSLSLSLPPSPLPLFSSPRLALFYPSPTPIRFFPSSCPTTLFKCKSLSPIEAPQNIGVDLSRYACVLFLVNAKQKRYLYRLDGETCLLIHVATLQIPVDRLDRFDRTIPPSVDLVLSSRIVCYSYLSLIDPLRCES